MSPLFQKRGNPNFENFRKGRVRKEIWGEVNQKVGDLHEEYGERTFQIEFRDRKGQK